MRAFTLFCTSLLFFLTLTPARADLEVKPFASVQQEYDSNINYASTNELSDSITRTVAGLNLTYEGKVDKINLRGDIAHRFFQKHSNFDNTSENLTLDLDHEFSRYDRINVTDTFGHGTEPRSLSEEFERSQGRYTFSINNFAASYTHDISSRLSGILRYGNEIDEYSRADLRDSTNNYWGAGAEFAFDSRNIGLLDYRYAVRDYSPGGSAKTSTITGGMRHYFSSQLSLEGVAGYDFIKAVNGVEYTDPVYRLTLSDMITDKLEGSLSYLWENTSSAYSSDVFKNQRWTLGFSDQMNARLKVNVQGFYGDGTYEQSNTNQVLAGGSVGFLYELFTHVKWSGSVSFTQQTSTVESNEYDRTFVSTGIRIEF